MEANGLKKTKNANSEITIIESKIIFNKQWRKRVRESISDVKFLKYSALFFFNKFEESLFKKFLNILRDIFSLKVAIKFDSKKATSIKIKYLLVKIKKNKISKELIELKLVFKKLPNGRLKLFSISKKEFIIKITIPNPKSSAIDAKNIKEISITAFFFCSLSRQDKILLIFINFIGK